MVQEKLLEPVFEDDKHHSIAELLVEEDDEFSKAVQEGILRLAELIARYAVQQFFSIRDFIADFREDFALRHGLDNISLFLCFAFCFLLVNLRNSAYKNGMGVTIYTLIIEFAPCKK